MVIGFTEEEKAHVSSAIIAAENETACEIMVVVSPHNHMLSIIGVMIAAMLAIIIPHIWHWYVQPISLMYLQLIEVLICLALIPMRIKLIPAFLHHKILRSAARKQFLRLVQGRTQQSSALMIYVSYRERYVEIIVDRMVAEQIPNMHWQKLVEHMTGKMPNASLSNVIIQTVQEAVVELRRAFPADLTKKNMLSNEVVVV